MSDILTAAEMLAADQETIAGGTPSQVLMERAATAALEVLCQKFDTTSVLFLCGGGNNGGDGLAMARFLMQRGQKAQVVFLGRLNAQGQPDTAAMSTECARQLSLLPADLKISTVPDLDGVTAVVDAIFGIGLDRPIEGRAKEIIEAVRAASIPTLALDIPSGLHADTGAIMGTVLPATHTVAIASLKWGHLLYPGAALCGEITTVDIGIHARCPGGALLQKEMLAQLPPRPARAHKGTFGRVLIVGGSVGMSGAAYFAAKAALRAGCGLSEIFTPADNRIIYQTQLPEALLTLYDPDELDTSLLQSALSRADAVALGMGLSQSETAKRIVAFVLERADVPLVVDADALNLVAQDPALQHLCFNRPFPTVLTPHLGEMSRLCRVDIPGLAANMVQCAKALAVKSKAILVMKDARTLITDGETVYLNPYGNSGMATGGSGDVLAGVIASLVAQGSAPMDAARLGVMVHALAGDAALEKCGSHGMMASDIIDGICSVLS